MNCLCCARGWLFKGRAGRPGHAIRLPSGPKPAGFGVEAGSKRRCASLRGGRLRPARLYEPQEQCFGLWVSGCALPGWAEGPARKPGDSSRNRAIRTRPKARQKALPPFTAQFCRVRAAASGPGIEDAPPHARRPFGSQKHDQQFGPTHSPKLGPARRENRSRFSRPKNSTAQSTTQFSAPCPPHCGSAIAPPLFRAPARFIYIRLTPK